MRILLAPALLCLPLVGAGPLEAFLRPESLAVLDDDARDARAAHDLVRLKSYVGGALRLRAALDAQRELFTRASDVPLAADERDEVLAAFAQVLDYTIGLDELARYHFDFFHIDPVDDPLRHARHFSLALGAYVSELALAWDFVERTQGRPQFERLLDEGSSTHGLAPGSYAGLKWATVHALDIGRLLAALQYRRFLAPFVETHAGRDEALSYALALVDSRRELMEDRVARTSAPLIAGNGLDLLVDRVHRMVFPVQKGVAEWLGDTRVRRHDAALISAAQIAAATDELRPGDVVLERRNWYLSNIGLPGFWPHTALYVGTVDDAAAAFDDDGEVTAAFGQPFTIALRERAPDAFAAWATPDDTGHAMRFLEAMSEGVVFTSAEHSLFCDYAAALRPRLSPVEKAKAIARAFTYHGRPYDFDFDFFTDAALVCSEVVYKAFEPRADAAGLALPLVPVVGRMTLPPNTMVAQFDATLGTDRQPFDFVWFLDGQERTGDAVRRDVDAFRASHRRPKWDVAQR